MAPLRVGIIGTGGIARTHTNDYYSKSPAEAQLVAVAEPDSAARDRFAKTYGIDPIYFGLLFVFNITLGGITPPVGAQLFVASSIWRVSMGEMMADLMPFIILQYAVMFVLMFFPDLITFLPRLLCY